MEERSLKVYSADRTFFSKITKTITKLLIPTKVGINGVIISMKRNNMLKTYENYREIIKADNSSRREEITRKNDEMYALYLEAIDKYVMDSIYKKVKNNTADGFEREALSKYYSITQLKDTEYVEYKYKKQKYLIELDYETFVTANRKSKILASYKRFYAEKMEALYKKILKNYSVRLSDNAKTGNKTEVYEKIFTTLENYISEILPLKLELEGDEDYKEILEQYDNFESFSVGKLDQNDAIEKRKLLLGMSRKLFTHSLPLVVAEKCYAELIKEVRTLMVDTMKIAKRDKSYHLLIDIMDEYNLKILSTKVYWDVPLDKERYKAFWNKYKENEKIKDKNPKEYQKQKEILLIKEDLKKVFTRENKYYKTIKFYKQKLVNMGAMKQLKNSYISEGDYTKKKVTVEA